MGACPFVDAHALSVSQLPDESEHWPFTAGKGWFAKQARGFEIHFLERIFLMLSFGNLRLRKTPSRTLSDTIRWLTPEAAARCGVPDGLWAFEIVTVELFEREVYPQYASGSFNKTAGKWCLRSPSGGTQQHSATMAGAASGRKLSRQCMYLPAYWMVDGARFELDSTRVFRPLPPEATVCEVYDYASRQVRQLQEGRVRSVYRIKEEADRRRKLGLPPRAVSPAPRGPAGVGAADGSYSSAERASLPAPEGDEEEHGEEEEAMPMTAGRGSRAELEQRVAACFEAARATAAAKGSARLPGVRTAPGSSGLTFLTPNLTSPSPSPSSQEPVHGWPDDGPEPHAISGGPAATAAAHPRAEEDEQPTAFERARYADAAAALAAAASGFDRERAMAAGGAGAASAHGADACSLPRWYSPARFDDGGYDHELLALEGLDDDDSEAHRLGSSSTAPPPIGRQRLAGRQRGHAPPPLPRAQQKSQALPHSRRRTFSALDAPEPQRAAANGGEKDAHAPPLLAPTALLATATRTASQGRPPLARAPSGGGRARAAAAHKRGDAPVASAAMPPGPVRSASEHSLGSSAAMAVSALCLDQPRAQEWRGGAGGGTAGSGGADLGPALYPFAPGKGWFAFNRHGKAIFFLERIFRMLAAPDTPLVRHPRSVLGEVVRWIPTEQVLRRASTGRRALCRRLCSRHPPHALLARGLPTSAPPLPRCRAQAQALGVPRGVRAFEICDTELFEAEVYPQFKSGSFRKTAKHWCILSPQPSAGAVQKLSVRCMYVPAYRQLDAPSAPQPIDVDAAFRCAERDPTLRASASTDARRDPPFAGPSPPCLCLPYVPHPSRSSCAGQWTRAGARRRWRLSSRCTSARLRSACAERCSRARRTANVWLSVASRFRPRRGDGLPRRSQRPPCTRHAHHISKELIDSCHLAIWANAISIIIIVL